MTFCYSIFEEEIVNPDIGSYRTCGIELTAQGNRIDYISDVSVSKVKAMKIVDSFNRNQLYPDHFKDVVEDMLVKLVEVRF